MSVKSFFRISGPPQLFRGGVDGPVDLGVVAAAAEVPGERLLDLVEGRGRVLLYESGGRHEEARSAETALIAVLFDESLLDRVELVARGQAFDRFHRLAVGADGEIHAGVNRSSVEEDGTAAALAPVADSLGAGEVELVAQDVEERFVGLDGEADLLAVDGQGDRLLVVDGDAAFLGRARLAGEGRA